MSNDLGKLFLTLPITCHRRYGSREIRLRYSQEELAITTLHDHHFECPAYYYLSSTWQMLGTLQVFPFHCKHAHSLFWYLGSILSTPGIRSCYLDLRCRYFFSITNTILSSLSDYSQHFGDKLRLYLVKTDFTLYVSLHPASHNKLAR